MTWTAFIALTLAGICLLGFLYFTRHVKRATSEAEPTRQPGMGDVLEKAPLNPELYSKIIFMVILASAGLAFLGYASWKVLLFHVWSLGFNLGFPIAIIPAIYLIDSLRMVAKGERGALYFFGIALKNVGPGPLFAPRFLVTLETKPIDIQPIEEPGPRDKIFWGDEEEPLPEGMVRPIFVIARSQVEARKEGEETENAPLDVQMQYGLGYYVFWSVSSDVATFLQNSRTIEEASAQLKAVSLTLLDQIIGTRTTEGTIAQQESVNREFVDRMCEQAVGMGVRIHKVGLQGFNLSHDMASAMRDRAKAKFEAETMNIQTEAETNRIRKFGAAEGDAAREREKGGLLGRAEGMESIVEKLKVTGNAVLAAEVIREGWPKSTVIAGAGAGTADLASAVKTVAAAFSEKP